MSHKNKVNLVMSAHRAWYFDVTGWLRGSATRARVQDTCMFLKWLWTVQQAFMHNQSPQCLRISMTLKFTFKILVNQLTCKCPVFGMRLSFWCPYFGHWV